MCTPSCAALLTDRLPVRSGMTGTYMLRMYSAQQASGLSATEITLPEALKAVHANYTAALVAHTCKYVFIPVAFPTTIGCGCADCLSERHDPPLLYNLDIDPGERYVLDPACDLQAAAALEVILAERSMHLAEVVPGPSQVDTPTYPALQPCSPAALLQRAPVPMFRELGSASLIRVVC